MPQTTPSTAQNAPPYAAVPAFAEVSRQMAAYQGKETDLNPWQLLYSERSGDRLFFARPASEENFYLASTGLYRAFITGLNWYSEYTPDENMPEELYDYDYVLKADNSFEMYFNSKTNLLHFKNNNKLFRLWGDSSNLWENVVFDKTKASADLAADRLIIETAPINEDIDGDNIPENLRLRMITDLSGEYADSSLYLAVDDNACFVFGDARQAVRFCPQIQLLASESDDTKAVIVNSALRTPLDGSLIEEIDSFAYRDKRIGTVNVVHPEMKTKVAGRAVFVEYPQFNEKFSFEIDDRTMDIYGEPENIFDANNPDYPLLLRRISLEETEGGGSRLAALEVFELYKVGRIYAVEISYAFKSGVLVPDSVRYTGGIYG